MNNVNLETLRAFAEAAQKDPAQARKIKKVVCEWNFAPGKPQVFGTVEFAIGKTVITADSPPFMGGNGLAPDPIQFCLFGLAACYATTFMSLASEEGLKLDKLAVAVENHMNLSRTIGLSNDPIVDEVRLALTVSGKASRQQLEAVNQLTLDRCPGIYCLRNPIKLTAVVNP